MRSRFPILLVDLPTFPKGTLSLSLFAVAAALGKSHPLEIHDLNFHALEDLPDGKAYAAIGLKVSAQNFHLAVETTLKLREMYPASPVLWGGEYPSLVPKICSEHADVVVSGPFEPIANDFLADLANGRLKKVYAGDSKEPFLNIRPPRFDLIKWEAESFRFMGLPLETSRGCTYKCTFCLVHQMQPGYVLKGLDQLEKELPAYAGRFINLVDYNFGVHPDHVIRTAAAIQASEALGWMAEMCLESLDNDEVLAALAASRCRIIYCGLESIDEDALRAVNKARTNQISNYQRIIRKVQSHGIQVAAGIIIGLPEKEASAARNSNAPTPFERARHFFQQTGIIYAKLTFLTYNPGTKVRESMRRTGTYTSEEASHQDGNHLSYLARGLKPEALYQDAEKFIRRYYHLFDIVRRSSKATTGFWARLEYILFNLCYRDVYTQWLERDIFRDENAFQHLLKQPLQKGWFLRQADSLLHWVRKKRYRKATGRKPVDAFHPIQVLDLPKYQAPVSKPAEVISPPLASFAQ